MNKVSANAGTHPATESLLITALPAGPHDLVTLRPGYDPAAFQTTKKLPRQVIVTDTPLVAPHRLEIIDNNGHSEIINVNPSWVPFALSVQPAQLGVATDVDVLVLW